MAYNYMDDLLNHLPKCNNFNRGSAHNTLKIRIRQLTDRIDPFFWERKELTRAQQLTYDYALFCIELRLAQAGIVHCSYRPHLHKSVARRIVAYQETANSLAILDLRASLALSEES